MTVFHRAHVPWGSIGTEAASAAIYLAWVAYPHAAEEAKRVDFVKACCAGIAKNLDVHPPENLRGFKRERIPGKVNRGLDRINKRRIPATRMALQQWGVDPHGKLGLNQSAKSLASLILQKSPDGEGPEPDNVRKDVWRDSLPALAMTLALPLELAAPDRSKTVIDLIKTGDWVPQAIQDARQIAPLVASFFNPPFILWPTKAKSPAAVSQ